MSQATPPAGAGAGAREQVARLLTLVPYLHARGTVRLGEAAEALGVTPEVVLRDLKVLWMCGLPSGYPDDLIDVDMSSLETEEGGVQRDGLIRVSNADYLDRPLRLSPTEASAIIVALRTLRITAEPPTVPIIDRVLDKLESAAAAAPVPLAVDGDVDAGARASSEAGLAELRRRLDDAVARQVQVELDYYVPARDELSHRVVDPFAVLDHDGHAYLQAWCHSAEAPRTFRLDRVATAVVLDTPVTSEPVPPRDLADGLFASDEEVTLVTLRLAPQARWVEEYYPVVAVRRSRRGPAGSVEVDLRVADERWLTKLMLRLAPNASVIAPTDFAEAFGRAALDTLGLYES